MWKRTRKSAVWSLVLVGGLAQAARAQESPNRRGHETSAGTTATQTTRQSADASAPGPALQARPARLTEEEFHVSPKIVRLPLSDETERMLCVAAIYQKGTRDIFLAANPVYGDRCAAGDPDFFYGQGVEGFTVEGLAVAPARFVGNAGERVIIDGEKWVLEKYPAAIYVRSKNANGKHQWDAFCMATIRQDPYALNGAIPKHPRLLVYRKQRSEVIDGSQHVYGDGIQEAWKKRFELEKPLFIGDVSKLEIDPAFAPSKQ